MNRNIYKSNMQLFEKSFPGISEIIENCRNSIEKETEVYFEQAADGNKIIKVKKEDRQLYFSGKREPADKARIEIEKWGKIDRHAVVFVTGLGDIAFLKHKGHRERVEGFEEYMKSEPEMTVKFVESGYANLQMSEQKVRDLMGQYPQIRGIMATSAVTAMGLVDELKDTDIKIVAVDEQEDSLKAVENGQILALAAQSGYEIGYETIHYIQNLRNGKHLKKKYYLNAEILTQDNVKEYRKKDESQKYKK